MCTDAGHEAGGSLFCGGDAGLCDGVGLKGSSVDEEGFALFPRADNMFADPGLAGSGDLVEA